MPIKHNMYEYSGSVMNFNTCIEQNWNATTWAPSEKKAYSNLTYRYKKENDLAPTAKIALPGKMIMKGE